MKAIISVVAIAVLMIGTPLVYAHRLTDTEQEAGITSDAQGRPCTFGPSHDECQYRFLEKIPGTPNNIDYHSGFKVGYSDGFNEGIYHHAKDNGGTASFSDGYTDGWLKGCVVGGGNSEDCNIQTDANTP